MKNTFNKANAKKLALKKKALEWESKYDRVSQSSKKFVEDLSTCKVETYKIIHNMRKSLENNDALQMK